MTRNKNYHYLLHNDNGVWGLAFGSYTKSEVSFERQRLRDVGVKSKNLLTFTAPNDTQDCLDKVLVGLNQVVG